MLVLYVVIDGRNSKCRTSKLCFIAYGKLFIDHNALVFNALQPRDFERQYFAAGEKAIF
jgi:hypothetical protein